MNRHSLALEGVNSYTCLGCDWTYTHPATREDGDETADLLFDIHLTGGRSFTTDDCLVAVSKWVDEYDDVDPNPEALLWSRVTKVCEEAGEAMSALLGMTGRNPRKGVYATQDDLIKELLDTAMAALGAVEHVTGNEGKARQLLDLHIVRIAERAGVI